MAFSSSGGRKLEAHLATEGRDVRVFVRRQVASRPPGSDAGPRARSALHQPHRRAREPSERPMKLYSQLPSPLRGSGELCARRSSWGWQIWRGMWSDGGHRGAMFNRWGSRVSVPDPRFGLHAFREFVQHIQDAVISSIANRISTPELSSTPVSAQIRMDGSSGCLISLRFRSADDFSK